MRDLLFDQQRATALQASCEYCSQPVGAVCINPHTQEPLEHQPAHFARIADGARAKAREATE